MEIKKNNKTSAAFAGASWFALIVGGVSYVIGLWNANMQLNEKGYYFTILLFGLFSAVSLQKSVRDQLEGMAITGMYFSLCWICTLAAIILLIIGLYNANLSLSEKGFFSMSFLLSMFAVVAVQKNIRDEKARELNGPE